MSAQCTFIYVSDAFNKCAPALISTDPDGFSEKKLSFDFVGNTKSFI